MAAIATGKKLEHLELTEAPNMPFLYWLAILGALIKPKWTSSKTWPSLKVPLDQGAHHRYPSELRYCWICPKQQGG